MGTARHAWRLDGLAVVHVLALAAVTLLALVRVLDAPAVMAGLGMVLHGFREAHRTKQDPPEPPADDASATGRATMEPPAPAPPPRKASGRQRAATPDGGAWGGFVAGLRRLSWVGGVVGAVALASCVSVPAGSNAPPFLLQTRAIVDKACDIARGALNAAVAIFDVPAVAPSSGGEHEAKPDASTDAPHETPSESLDAGLDASES